MSGHFGTSAEVSYGHCGTGAEMSWVRSVSTPFICGAGAWFNLGVAGMAGECFIRVGPVCQCSRCVLYTDRSKRRDFAIF